MYSAIYMPSLAEGQEDPSRDGFATEAEAEEFVFSRMCSRCTEELENHRKGLPEHHEYSDTDWKPGDKVVWCDSWPACACEWMVGKTEAFEQSESIEDFMKAAGFGEPIYRRPENPEEQC